MLSDHTYDFGRASKQEPKTIITPTTIDHIKEALKTEKGGIAVRGKGHCTGGQSLATGGTVIDMKSYSKINGIVEQEADSYVVEVEAGALWKDVFNYCLSKGLMPPTYADWLDLTVGGTISTGGVGQCSFKKGLQIDNVISLEVITGNGETLHCNKEKNSFLFDLTRGGLGHYGVISKVWMKVESAPKVVVVHKLLYANLNQYLLAQTKFTSFEKIDAIQSHIITNEREELNRRLATVLPENVNNSLSKNTQAFIIEVTQYSCKARDDFKAFLNNNSDVKPLYMHSYETSFKQHVNRVPPLLENPLEIGKPKHHHCCFFIGASQAAELLAYVFSQNEHDQAMGKGTILVIPLKRSLIKSKYFVLPNEEEQFFIGILRRHLEPYPFDNLIQINERTYQKALNLGGNIYPVGSGKFLSDPIYFGRHIMVAFILWFLKVKGSLILVQNYHRISRSFNFTQATLAKVI